MKSEMEMETAVDGGQLLLCLLWGELFSRCSRAKAETGRAEGEIEQKDVSNRIFNGLSPGLRLDFNALHSSDVFGGGKATSRDRRENTVLADMELHAQWPQVMK